jgi:hypothetical protein
LFVNAEHQVEDAGSKIKGAYDSAASTVGEQVGYAKGATADAAEALHNAAIYAQDGVLTAKEGVQGAVHAAKEAIEEAIDHGEIKVARLLHTAADTLEGKK